jgi:hypothetical protein
MEKPISKQKSDGMTCSNVQANKLSGYLKENTPESPTDRDTIEKI